MTVAELNPEGTLDLTRLIERGMKGVSKRELHQVARRLDLSLKEMAVVLPVSDRTVQRYRSSDRFNPVVSERILQIDRVAARAEAVLGERSVQWLKHPIRALGDRTPLSLLHSEFGIELVLDELGRIEHGVAA